MKKLIVAVVLTAVTVTPAVANDWIAPLIGGVIIGSVLNNRPNPNVYNGYPNQPIIINQPPVYNPNPLFREYYNCLVPVRDQYTGVVRNEVMTCTR